MRGGAERGEDAHPGVNAGGAAQSQHDRGSATCFCVRDEHAGAIGIGVERIKAVLHGWQPGGRGDVNERSGSGENIACLSQAANGVGSGQGNGFGGLSAGRCCLCKDSGGTFAAIGHGQGGHRGVGKRLAHPHSNAGCSLGRGGGAFKRVWGDDNMHARNYKARVQ